MFGLLSSTEQRLWDGLPGVYESYHLRHHDGFFDDQNGPQYSSTGDSEIRSRAPTDPAYESELVQRSTYNGVLRTGEKTKMVEARAFRFQNGKWSLWEVDDDEVVIKKTADINLVPSKKWEPIMMRAEVPLKMR